MVSWNDVRNHLDSGEEISAIPEGSEVLPVVGMSFVEGYPDNITALTKDSFIHLNRNPDNKFDGNAIEVRFRDTMLGHLSKDVAARLAPIMDSGVGYDVSVYRVRISPENPHNPGLDILLQKVLR